MPDIEPELVAAAVVKGMDLLQRGVTDYTRWSRVMVNNFGEPIRPRLEQIWIFSREKLQEQDAGASRSVADRTARPSAQWFSRPRPTLVWPWLIAGGVLAASWWSDPAKTEGRNEMRIVASGNSNDSPVELTIQKPKKSEQDPIEELQSRAQQGDVKAQFELACSYSTGQNVPQDYAEALGWYQRAAEQGDAEAQFNLGEIYADGEGVPQDYDEAIDWLSRAASQGNLCAKDVLPIVVAAKSEWSSIIKIRDGGRHKDFTVVGKTRDSLMVKYTSDRGGIGIAQLRFENVADGLRKQYNYEPVKADARKLDVAKAQPMVGSAQTQTFDRVRRDWQANESNSNLRERSRPPEMFRSSSDGSRRQQSRDYRP